MYTLVYYLKVGIFGWHVRFSYFRVGAYKRFITRDIEHILDYVLGILAALYGTCARPDHRY